MSSNKEKIIFEDNFDSGLKQGWEWLRQNKECWRIQDSGLEIRVVPGDENTVKNALIRSAPNRNNGTFAIEVSVSNYNRPVQPYEQAGITWYNNARPIAKLVKEYIYPPNVPHKTGNNIFIFTGDVSIQQQKVRLRFIVSRDLWKAQYHFEKRAEFKTAASGKLPTPKNDSVSIQCYNGPANAEHWVRFENFQIKQIS